MIKTQTIGDTTTVQHFNSAGQLHREDGPASIIYREEDGLPRMVAFSWWREDRLHREDGPAIWDEAGNEQWYFNHRLHREDGPAATFPTSGIKRWALHGKHYEDGTFTKRIPLK